MPGDSSWCGLHHLDRRPGGAVQLGQQGGGACAAGRGAKEARYDFAVPLVLDEAVAVGVSEWKRLPNRAGEMPDGRRGERSS